MISPALLLDGCSPARLQDSVRKRLAGRNHNGGVSMQERVALLRQAGDVEVQEFLQQAQAALDGMHVLPGTMDLPAFVGNPPRWHDNPTKDEEYIWCLNRMEHWLVLLRAFALTRESKYAQKVVSELSDWMEQCPRPPINREPDAAYKAFYAVTPWRALEVGIRMFQVWPHVIANLVDTEFLSAQLLARMVESMQEHAEALATISPIFWPRADHNHYLMENLGLLTVSVLLPELAGSSRWFAHAVRELERCAAAQLTEEGGQIEGCPSYHNGCVYWFCLAQQLAAHRPDGASGFSEAYQRRIAGSLNYTMHSLRPTGVTVPWGDSDPTDSATQAATWWFDTTGDAVPLSTISRLTGKQQARKYILNLAMMLRDPAAALRCLESLPAGQPSTMLWAKGLDQAAVRSSWEADALSIFFACRSPVNNGHAHIDPMGFDFTAFGQAMLVDPGRYTYRECPERIFIKSTAAHNAVTVNHRDAFEYKSTWYFGPQQPGNITHVFHEPRIRGAMATHDNFIPSVHRRMVSLVDGCCLLVIDALEHLPTDASVQLYFHADSTNVHWVIPNAAAMIEFPTTIAHCLFAGSSGPLTGTSLSGKVSTRIDSWHDSTRLQLEDPGGNAVAGGHRVYASLIVPARAGKHVVAPASLSVRRDDSGIHCQWRRDTDTFQVTWSNKNVAVITNP